MAPRGGVGSVIAAELVGTEPENSKVASDHNGELVQIRYRPVSTSHARTSRIRNPRLTFLRQRRSSAQDRVRERHRITRNAASPIAGSPERR
jgi:hypothetical protein